MMNVGNVDWKGMTRGTGGYIIKINMNVLLMRNGKHGCNF